MTLKVYIEPRFEGIDTGDGGIRRVVEAQRQWLPKFGVNVVDNVGEADLIHSHAVINVKTDKPIVLTCHGLYWADYQWEPWCNAANVEVLNGIRKADAVTAVSGWVARAIERNAWVKPTTIYHGIDPALWPVRRGGHGTRTPYILWNKTRTDPICDPSPMSELARLAPDIKFVSTFGTEAPNVTITGKVPFEQAKEYVYSTGVYLATSRETMGIGTLEAMAAGVPILGFAWGGTSEIVDHKVDGWLVRPGDFLSLEKGLRYCLENRERMGRAARAKVLDKFTWNKVIPQYVELYERVLAEHADRIKVSVVIPCYNLGQYLESAVESVVTQPPVVGGGEIVIVDDASTDDSGAIADTIASKYAGIRVIHNSSNEYLAGALNVGIGAARGEYIVPLDADNLLGPNSLKTLVDALDKSDRNIDIAYGKMEVIPDDGTDEWVSDWPGQFNYAAQMNHQNQITSTAMYRRKVWERIGGYRRRCRTAEDADFWCRATSFGARAAKVTDAVVLRYRNRHDSMSRVNADWPWNKWYAWWKADNSDGVKGIAPAVSPLQGAIWTFEPPKISVIIPVGPNHGRLVVDAVDSLLAQDFHWWEAIIINDSGAPLEFIHPFATVINPTGVRPSNNNGGSPARARNAGFAVARGKAILPLDADDYLQPGALTALWNKFAELGGESYIYSDWVVQETGEIKETNEYDCEELLHHLPHAVTALYPRAAWKVVGGFDEGLDAWEDWDFVLNLASNGVCGQRVAQPLVQYRLNGGTRREELYSRRETLIENIKHKWERYFVKGEKLMACRGCGGAKTAAQAFAQNQGDLMAEQPRAPIVGGSNGSGMVLLEYVGLVSGPITYRGQATGTMYRFGIDPYHSIKYVMAADADALLMRKEFQLGKPTTELLQAAGR